MALFESYERRIDQIITAIKPYGMDKVEDAKTICDEAGVDVAQIVKDCPAYLF